MPKKRREVAVWLQDDAARLMVGALPSGNLPSRWAVQGEIVEEVMAGIWLKANTIQEFRPITSGPNQTTKQIDWLFKSEQLLIMWGAILTIQAFEGGQIDIGFRTALPEDSNGWTR